MAQRSIIIHFKRQGYRVTRLLLALIALAGPALGVGHAADAGSLEWEARLRVVKQLSREMNNRDLVDRVEALAKAWQDGSAPPAARETALAELESKVGIDPGGWSMSGLRIFHPTQELTRAMQPLGVSLSEAMDREDLPAIQAVIAEFSRVMGDQAGTPDARSQGFRAPAVKVSEAENVTVFIRALEGEGKSLRQIRDGQQPPGQTLRLYANLASALCEIRPAAQRHAPDRVPDLDKVLRGACRIMTDVQQPGGFFPFPDLRGKNIRFGDMTERLLESGQGTVKDGWIVSVDPTGGTQFDTGECGMALLQAGALLGNADWTRAGLRAADWAMGQKCAGNFNYNAFSVSLLAAAYAQTGKAAYWQAAWQKWSVGVAPGQTETGRWIDPHNARTVYHLIILRAINDLLAALPASQPVADREALNHVADLAAQVVVDEFARLGVTNTSYALRELIRFRDLRSATDEPLQAAIEQAAAVVYSRSVQGDRAKLGASATELAVMHRAFRR